MSAFLRQTRLFYTMSLGKIALKEFILVLDKGVVGADEKGLVLGQVYSS